MTNKHTLPFIPSSVKKIYEAQLEQAREQTQSMTQELALLAKDLTLVKSERASNTIKQAQQELRMRIKNTLDPQKVAHQAAQRLTNEQLMPLMEQVSNHLTSILKQPLSQDMV